MRLQQGGIKLRGGAIAVFWMLAVLWAPVVRASDVSPSDLDMLRKEIAELRKDNEDMRKTTGQLTDKIVPISGTCEQALDSKYGPNAPVTTKVGKLVIGGLLQVWYYSPQKDHVGLFQDSALNGVQDSNYASSNDSFRIRRSEIHLTYQMNDIVGWKVMIDPSNENLSYPNASDNQATQSIFKRGLNANLANVQSGAGAAPRLLQDAYITIKDFIPHHDFRIGEFRPPQGEEGSQRSNAQLDFAERSMLGQLSVIRDQGIEAHGSWWEDCDTAPRDGRVQYQLGVFNGPGNYYYSGGSFSNRADDNNAKDMAGRILVRPLWKHETWGSLELGYSLEAGIHGQDGAPDPIDSPVNGLNRRKTWANRQNPWAYYAPGGVVKGWWIRGEWQRQYDRNAPQSVIDLLGNGNAGDGTTQTNGKPFASQGWFVSTGYKLDQLSACSVPAWVRNLEFAFRYDTYQNVEIADLVRNDHTDVFATSVYTAGIHYWISGDTKIQADYNVVENPSANNPNIRFHNVKNNMFIVNFQVAF